MGKGNTMVNNIKKKLEKNELVVGCFINMYSPYLAEVAGHCGFDFIVIDNEHGSFSWGEVEEMIRAIETTKATPFVRVSGASPTDIMKALDRGAMGLHVPHVETLEQVEQIIQAAKYPPAGTRGVAFSVRAAKYGLEGGKSYLEKSNKDVFLVIQLETPTAIEQVDVMMKKDIDMVYVGPTDLSASLNRIEDKITHPEIKTLIDKVFAAGKKNNVRVGIHIANASEWNERRFWGANYMGIAINAIVNPAIKGFLDGLDKEKQL